MNTAECYVQSVVNDTSKNGQLVKQLRLILLSFIFY